MTFISPKRLIPSWRKIVDEGVGGLGIPGSIRFQVNAGAGAVFDPVIVTAPGCPHTPHWDFGDGNTDTGLAVTNTYVGAGLYTVKLSIPDIGTWLTEINVYNDNIYGDFLSAIQPCKALTNVTAHQNTELTGDIALLTNLPNLTTIRFGDYTGVSGDIADLASMTQLVSLTLSATSVVGDIADLSPLTNLETFDLHANNPITGDLGDITALSKLKYLMIRDTSITGELTDIAGMTDIWYLNLAGRPITGALSDISSLTALQQLIINYCTSITGDVEDIVSTASYFFFIAHGSGIDSADLSSFTKLLQADVYDCGWNQATVDACLLAAYTARNNYTRPTITLNIHGTNAAPGGIYQYAAVPSTGKEYAYALENDDDAEGFSIWTINYS